MSERFLGKELLGEPSEMQLGMAKYVRGEMAAERQLLSGKPYLFNPRKIEIDPNSLPDSSILKSVKFISAFEKIMEWSRTDRRELRIEGYSMSGVGTAFLVITTPADLKEGRWIDQSFSVDRTNFGFALEEDNGKVRVVRQGELTDEQMKELWLALISAYDVQSEDGEDLDESWKRYRENEKREEKFLHTLMQGDGDRFGKIMGDYALNPERFMEDGEMAKWKGLLKRIPTTPIKDNYSLISRQVSFGFGEYLLDDWINAEGFSKGYPSVIVPIHCYADGHSVWTTATLIYKEKNLRAVHFNHGDKHLPEMLRIISK